MCVCVCVCVCVQRATFHGLRPTILSRNFTERHPLTSHQSPVTSQYFLNFFYSSLLTPLLPCISIFAQFFTFLFLTPSLLHFPLLHLTPSPFTCHLQFVARSLAFLALYSSLDILPDLARAKVNLLFNQMTHRCDSSRVALAFHASPQS